MMMGPGDDFELHPFLLELQKMKTYQYAADYEDIRCRFCNGLVMRNAVIEQVGKLDKGSRACTTLSMSQEFRALHVTRSESLRKKWRKAGCVLIAIQRIQRGAEATAKANCEQDLTTAMLLGNNAIEGAPPAGILAMVWEMGRASAGVKRPHSA